jgi:hypothetical protein
MGRGEVIAVQKDHVHARRSGARNVVLETIPDIQGVPRIDSHAFRSDFENLRMRLGVPDIP